MDVYNYLVLWRMVLSVQVKEHFVEVEDVVRQTFPTLAIIMSLVKRTYLM